MWRPARPSQKSTLINTGLNEVYTATFSPDPTLIATGGYSKKDERIKI